MSPCKLKQLLITACCIVAVLWTETLGMQDSQNKINEDCASIFAIKDTTIEIFDRVVIFDNSEQGKRKLRSEQGKLREALFKNGFLLTKVCSSWNKIILTEYPEFLDCYYSAWTLPSHEGFYLNKVTQPVYNQCWFWNGPWSLFEDYYVNMPSVNSDYFPKLNINHLSTLVVQSDFKPENLGSLSFLKSLLPQLRLKELTIDIGNKKSDFLRLLFDTCPSQINLEKLVLKGLNFAPEGNGCSLLTLMPTLPCQQLTWVDVKWHPLSIRSLANSLKDCTNLKRFKIQNISHHIDDLVTGIVESKNGFSQIELIMDPEVLIKCGRKYSSSYNSNLQISRQFFQMAINGGEKLIGTFWLAELLFGSSEKEIRDKSKELYENLLSDFKTDSPDNKKEDEKIKIAEVRLCELLSDGKEENIKDVIFKYYEQFIQSKQGGEEEYKITDTYKNSLLNFAWILRNFPKLLSLRENKTNIIEFLNEKKIIKQNSEASLSEEVENLYLHICSSKRSDFVVSGMKQLYRLLEKENPRKLKGHLERTLRELPKKSNDRVLLFMLGQFYEKQEKDFDLAEKNYREAARDLCGDKGSSFAMASLGNLLLKRERNICEYLRLHKESASLGNSYSAFYLYNAYKKGGVHGIKLPAEELENKGKNADKWLHKAHILGNTWATEIMYKELTNKGEYQEAINFLNNSISPSFSFYYDSMGYCYMKIYSTTNNNSDFEKAKKNLEEGIKYTVQSYGNLGWLYYLYSTNRPKEEEKEKLADLNLAQNHALKAIQHTEMAIQELSERGNDNLQARRGLKKNLSDLKKNLSDLKKNFVIIVESSIAENMRQQQPNDTGN